MVIFLESIVAQVHTPIPLGIRGENLARQIIFDISQWRKLYGAGRVELLHQRQNDVNPYPVVPECDGDYVYWKVHDYDTDQVCHYGKAELRYFRGNLGSEQTIVKSVTYRTEVLPALGPPVADVPETEPDWIAQFEEVVQNAEEKMQAMSALTAQGEEIQQSVAEKQQLIAQSVTDAQTAADTARRFLYDFSPLISRSGNPIGITDGAEQLEIENLNVTLPISQSGSGIASMSNIRPFVKYLNLTVTANGVPATTVFTGAENFQHFAAGTFNVLSGKLTATHRLFTLDGVSPGCKFSTKNSSTAVDCYTIATDGSVSCANPGSDDVTGGILCSHAGAVPYSEAVSGNLTINRRPQITSITRVTEVGETATLTLDFGLGNLAASSVTGMQYVHSGTGETVTLAVNSTEFQVNGTTATVTVSGLVFHATAWQILFDNATVEFVPVIREDLDNASEPNPFVTPLEKALTGVCIRSSDRGVENPVQFAFDLTVGMDTLEKANAWLQAQYTAGNPVEICYEYAQPIEYQFPARELYTLLGANTFSADTGTLAVKYHADPGRLYDKIRAAFVDLGVNL